MDRRSFLAGACASVGAMSAAGAASRLGAEKKDGAITLTCDGRVVARYLAEPVAGPAGVGPLFTRGAYLHPLQAPNGALVTDDFPADHRHQRGAFFAWTKTEVGELHPDFWNLGSSTGRIRPLTAGVLRGEGLHVGFSASHLWELARGEAWEPALRETWEVTLHPVAFADPLAPQSAYVLDLTSRQKPAVRIELPQYRYGGMCVRGAAEWTGKTSKMQVLTSEGKDWKNAEETHARWADMSGPVGGRQAGVTLMEHPSNLRAPNLLRVPPEFPYVVYCPSKGESLTLEAGQEYTFRYRIVCHNGPADAAALNRIWREFAA